MRDATELARAIADGELGAAEAVERCLDAARAASSLGALLAVHAESALERARALDRARARGDALGPLHGVPVVLKANLCVRGVETSCASRVLAGYRPPYTATAVERLVAAGAVPFATANMDEFAMGSSGENSAFFPSRNPWSPERAPGGSSSGSAVAVAAGIAPLALGSETGGSVRQPAALCGISGFKPSYGRVSRYGLVAFGSSLDQIAPLARSARDLELALAAISGADPLDATSLPEGPCRPDPAGSLRGLVVGVPRECFGDGLHAGVALRTQEALEELRRLGAETRELSLPSLAVGVPLYYVVAAAEASSNLARFDGVRFGLRVEGDGSLEGMMAATRDRGFGEEVERRILLGTYVLSSGYHDQWYGRAQRVRAKLAAEYAEAFASCDLLAGPTSPTPAFRLGERAGDPVAMYLSDVLTAPVNLAGLPAVSVPCGLVEEDGERLPAGLQLVGGPRADALVLRAARVYQAATDHHEAAPDPAAWRGAAAREAGA